MWTSNHIYPLHLWVVGLFFLQLACTNPIDQRKHVEARSPQRGGGGHGGGGGNRGGGGGGYRGGGGGNRGFGGGGGGRGGENGFGELVELGLGAAAVGGLLGLLSGGAEAPAPANPWAPKPAAAAPPPFAPPPPAPVASSGKMNTMTVTTVNGGVYCWKYPDTMMSDHSKLPVYNSFSRIDIQCWTSTDMNGVSGNIAGDSTWFKTATGCYLNELDIEEKQNLRNRLNYCQPPQHWVGTLQSQYQRVDCYDCTSLNCQSKNIGVPPYVDLACYIEGETVLGNSTWVKSEGENCFLPGSAFNPYGWGGTAGRRC